MVGDKKIAYVPLLAEVLHYGIVRLLHTADEEADHVIVGLVSDQEAYRQRGTIITNYKERLKVINELKCVDEVMVQDDMDPTKNLKALHKKYPKDKLYLFHGDNWKNPIPGSDFIHAIGGAVMTPAYYNRLSVNYIKKGFENYTEHFDISNIQYFNKASKLGTKAKTLQNLQPILKKSKIEDLMIFTTKQFEENQEAILDKIHKTFGDDEVITRSSTLNEDSFDESKAGHYTSISEVSVLDREKAIKQVMDTYDNNPDNEILVQRHTKNIIYSGVVFTRKIDGSPYYIINYDDSGSTDSITSGSADKKVEIIRNIDLEICSYPWNLVIDAIREIESFIPNTVLDIEFAVNKKKEVIIFQVRPLAANKISTDISDDEIYAEIKEMKKDFESGNAYSDMAFWNPSEMIGAKPHPLDYSLYEYLITHEIWNDALNPLGYSNSPTPDLMMKFGGKPYIDLNNTFHALLPADLPEDLREKLIAFYFWKLYKNPEIHDKIEFELVHNCYSYTFNDRELCESGFTSEEIDILRKSLVELTENILDNYKDWLREAILNIFPMEERRKHDYSIYSINKIKSFLNDCIIYGTIPFSKMARLAFIGKATLNSMVEEKVITQKMSGKFMNSISTVASEYDGSEKYRHLRPGTYDITSPRYDQMKMRQVKPKKKRKFNLPTHLKQEQDFIVKTIQHRELLKFEFTKNISEALESIAEFGKTLGFSREDMSFLDIKTILSSKNRSEKDIEEIWGTIISERRRKRGIYKKLSLPPLLFSKNDFEVVPTYIARPNFVTEKSVSGEIVVLDIKKPKITGKIVLIENADPGYDWIFSENIKGLITCYGGVASHMAIRCAEFGLPASIGCGTELFNKIKNWKRIEMDCKKGEIKNGRKQI